MTTPQSPLHLLQDPSLLKTAGYINGTWVQGPDTFAVTDPATGLELAQVANLTPTHTQQAIDAAEAALPAWRSLTHKQRSQLLRKWFDLIMAHRDDLARLMTAEQGKPLAEATGEVVYGATFVEWYAEEAKRTYGETVPSFAPDRRAMVLRQPIGVCAAITPWNFPVAMITRKVAPAIAAGCTVVVKPAEFTPLCALALAELAHRAGIPQGVINVVPTEHAAAVGKVLCDSPVVRHLSFTGSTEVGRILMAQCAPTIKKLALELGGNAPFIVFDDADLDSAVEGAMTSKYRNAGQTCVCANRLYVQDGVYDAFVAKLATRARGIKVGNGFDAGVNQGPLIDANAIAKVEAHVADALAKGARLVAGGKRLGERFYAPTVLADVTDEMQCAPTVKKMSLELGGNAPFIVFDDADLDSAVEGALASKYRNAGQTCVCANRLYVQDGVYDAFVKKLAAKVKAMKVGNGFDEGVTVGPLIEPAALTKVEKHVKDAVKKGGKLVTGGSRLKGQFFEPTVISGATAPMLVAREETFGPLAPVFRFKTEQEAIDAANATIFGLASYFYARDIGRITRVSEALEYGIVGINTGIISVEQAPFGGVKQSGLGREGSSHGLDEYLEMKYLCIGDIHK